MTKLDLNYIVSETAEKQDIPVRSSSSFNEEKLECRDIQPLLSKKVEQCL